MRYLSAALLVLIGCPALSWADGDLQDKSYVVARLTQVQFRSIHGAQAAKLPATEWVLGSYLNDYVRVEGRIGTTFGTDEPNPGLKVGLKYWGSWYIGGQYPVSDSMRVYGLYGFSYVQGKASREDKRSYPDIPSEYLSSSFSISYEVGADFKVVDNWYGNLEIGRIHNDSQTKIRTLQAGIGIKYEF